MATKLKSYSATAASNNSAPPDGWPEGMLPSAVNNSAREMMARLAEWYADAEWILRNDTVTGFTGTTLTITGDVTAKYTKNRPIRLDESGSKVAAIVSSSYGAPSTTVTIAGYTIVGTPTSIELGVLDTSHNYARQDVASAATVVLDGTGAYVRITGTTGITAITLASGQRRDVVAGGAFTITTGASLIIDGLASGTTYTFADGDTFRVFGEASSVVRITGVRLPGAVVGFAVATSTTGDSTALQIPYDTSIPQIGEGKEYLTVAYTPRYANSKLLLTFAAPVVDAAAATVAAFSFFRDAGADAIASFAKPTGTAVDSVYLTAVTNATAASASTFRLRYGPSSAATTVHINQIVGPANRFGTAAIATFTVTEIKQ